MAVCTQNTHNTDTSGLKAFVGGSLRADEALSSSERPPAPAQPSAPPEPKLLRNIMGKVKMCAGFFSTPSDRSPSILALEMSVTRAPVTAR